MIAFPVTARNSETFRRGDPDLVARARAGDEAAFEALVAQYRTAIFNFLYRQTADRDVAEDLTQDTFLKAWLALPATRDDLRVGAWLYRIARNCFLDHGRHESLIKWQPWDAYTAVFHPSQVADDSPEREALRAEGAQEVRAVLDAMREEHPRYARLLELREFEDLNYADIAAAAGLTWAAAKSMLFRARDEFVQTCRRTGIRPFGYDPEDAPKRRLGGAA